MNRTYFGLFGAPGGVAEASKSQVPLRAPLSLRRLRVPVMVPLKGTCKGSTTRLHKEGSCRGSIFGFLSRYHKGLGFRV